MVKKSGKVKRRKTPAKSSAKAAAKKTKTVAALTGPRKLRGLKKLPNAYRLSRQSFATVWRYRKLFFGISLIYGLLNLILVKGLSNGTDVSSLKSELNKVFTGNLGSLLSGLSIFAILVGSAGNGSSQTAGVYQLLLAIIVSLAIIWALREVLKGNRARIRDAYYQGMYPLIPFLLVLFVVGLELIPFLAGAWVYANVVTAGIAKTIAEQAIFIAILVLLTAFSMYLISSSIFALYIVTLPNMTPFRALRSARALVKKRRLPIIRKLLCLPLILLVIAAIIMLPIILLLTPIAQWVFFILTMLAMLAVNSYIYTLYRELVDG